ncbi:inverse autotransporter beta domain-containing protein, partial [Klebsiella pneumoniae]|uniref:inverse autotransporter beta domain-containing protein n=1 Tax=Klebsiella pneumoniae TaxID=573 RepID=UPI0022468C2B
LDPDLILLDLNMPGMNGLETLDKLREKSLSGRVVVFSVSNHEEDVVTAQARLPFYQHINTSVSVEQYFGDSVDLFHSGTGYHNPVAVSVGLNYTPVPLVTVTAKHKQGENGVSQNNVGLKLNYRFRI